VGGDGSDAGDGAEQGAVGPQPLGGGDEGVGLVLESVGLFLQEGDGAGDRLSRRAAQAGGGEAGLLAGGELAEVVAAGLLLAGENHYTANAVAKTAMTCGRSGHRGRSCHLG
jgi:hypothetical protein